jgi:hypothetical protein
MGIAYKATKLVFVGTAAWLLAAAGAAAQTDPEGGDVSANGSLSAGTSLNAQPSAAPVTAEPTPPPVTSEDTSATAPGASDHEAVEGRLGIGFFGVETLPILNDTAADFTATQNNLLAPTIGARYWLNTDLAIEAALGLAITSDSVEPPGGMDVSTSGFGLALHGGVPIALAYSGHFVLEVEPLLNFGIASGSQETTLPMGTATVDTSGLLFEIGARIGGEIHFGFMDLPDLALVGSVGLTIRSESGSFEPMGGMSTDHSTLTISTVRGDDPWEIFSGNIAAIYYL